MNVYVLSTLTVGLDYLRLLAGDVPIRGVIGLSDRDPGDAISGFVYMEPFCREHGLDFVPVSSYSLNAAEDVTALEALDIDLLLVSGWQRLIPEWLIAHCTIGAIGAHGSTAGISGGRGRSPQNWALIMRQDRFEISIFWLTPGIDSGPVIDTQTFPLSEADDIQSSYRKATWSTAKMVAAAYADGRLNARRGEDQSGDAFYLPQRKPEDGEIDWRRAAPEIDALVRALTRPYPGAFCGTAGGGRLKVWRGRVFDAPLEPANAVPGQIVGRFEDGTLIVATGSGPYLIEDWSIDPEPDPPPKIGVTLKSGDFSARMAAVLKRHRENYPDLPIAQDLIDFAES